MEKRTKVWDIRASEDEQKSHRWVHGILLRFEALLPVPLLRDDEDDGVVNCKS